MDAEKVMQNLSVVICETCLQRGIQFIQGRYINDVGWIGFCRSCLAPLTIVRTSNTYSRCLIFSQINSDHVTAHALLVLLLVE